MRGSERFVLLSNGQRVESSTGKPGLKISEFKEYGTVIGQSEGGAANEKSVKTIATVQLLAEPQPLYAAELGWRVGLALAALNFVVLALALSSVNPRASRSGHLVLALFAFIVYYNFMVLGQSWVASGKMGLWPFMALLHGGILVLSALLLAARHNHWSPRRWWQRRSAA